MGDRLIHYAAYKSMYKLLDWLIQNNADVIVKNHVNFIHKSREDSLLLI